MSAYQIPTPAGQRLPEAENLFKFLLFCTLLQASFVMTSRAIAASDGFLTVQIALTVAAASLNSVLIIGLGVLAHDAVHRVLFRNAWLNEIIGGVSDALMLTPFNANRQFHLTHHGHAHQPDLDPENEMHQRPFWMAMTIGTLLGLFLQYRILLVNLFTRMRDSRYTRRVLADLSFLAVAALFYLLLPTLLGADLWWSVLPTWLVFPVIFSFRAISDHYGVPAVASKTAQRQDILDGADWYDPKDKVRVTGWVVRTHPLLEWLWSSVNYHEVHHKYPWLAHVHLRDAFQHTQAHEPYLVVEGYTRSLLNLRGRLYYEEPAKLRDYFSPQSSAN